MQSFTKGQLIFPCFIFFGKRLFPNWVSSCSKRSILIWYFGCYSHLFLIFDNSDIDLSLLIFVWRFSNEDFIKKNPLTPVVGCPTLHDMHQITPSKKYVIPIYKKNGFPQFLEFSCIIFCFRRMRQKYKGFSKIIEEKCSVLAFQLFHFKTIS